MAEFDAIIVPGARVYADGSLSPTFRRRLDRAAERHAEGLAPVLVVSGLGPGGVSEGRAGAAYLEQRGVPLQAVLVEDRAANTGENARFSAVLVQGHVWVVTCDFHVRRCRWVFAEHFERVEVEGVQGTRWLRPRLRESVSVIRYLLRSASTAS